MRASSMYRRFLCPGSEQAEAGLKSKDTEASTSGTRCHEALRLFFEAQDGNMGKYEDYYNKTLSEREKGIVDAFRTKAYGIGMAHGGFREVFTEESYTWNGIEGTFDLCFWCEDGSWHIVDYKTGYAETDPADESLQLRTYAVLLAQHFFDHIIEESSHFLIFCHLFSAGNDREERYSTTMYDRDAIKIAEAELLTIKEWCESPTAKRVPDLKACQYCKACGNIERCPESMNEVSHAVTTNTLEAISILKKPSPELAKRLPAMLEQVKLAEKVCASFKSWLKDILTEFPDAAPGLAMKEGATRRTVIDPGRVFAHGLKEGWWKQDEFVENCVTVSISDVESLLKRNLDLTSKGAKELANDAFSDCIETKQSAPTIEVLKNDKPSD